MTKRSRFERAQRTKESERTKEIQAAWYASMPSDTAAEFARQVKAAHERGPAAPAPNMAPGTAPRPPRPGHEPKVKDERGTKRRSY